MLAQATTAVPFEDRILEFIGKLGPLDDENRLNITRTEAVVFIAKCCDSFARVRIRVCVNECLCVCV
jgi:hypothetical protein